MIKCERFQSRVRRYILSMSHYSGIHVLTNHFLIKFTAKGLRVTVGSRAVPILAPVIILQVLANCKSIIQIFHLSSISTILVHVQVKF